MESDGKQPRRIAVPGTWLAMVGPGLVFLGIFIFGAMQPQTALFLNLGMASVIGAALVDPKLRKDLLRLRHLTLPAVLFGLTLAVCLWSLTPYVPGGPHPVWAYAGFAPGAGTVDRSTTLLQITKLAGLSVVFLVGAAAGAQDERAKLTLHVLLGLAGAYAAWAFFVHVTGSGPDGRTLRLMASLANPNASATLFGSLLILFVAMGVRTAKTRNSSRAMILALIFAGGLLCAANLLLTASRAGFAATLAGLVAFGALQVIVGRARPSRALLLGIAAVSVAVLVVFLIGEHLIIRSANTADDYEVRMRIFAPHWEAFLRSPLLGYGLGAFEPVNKSLLNETNFRVLWDIRALHNVYLQWLEQAGLLGAIPMFAAVAALIATTLRKAGTRRRMTAPLYGLIAISPVFLVHGLTDFALEMHALAAFWAFVLGLQFSLAQGTSAR